LTYAIVIQNRLFMNAILMIQNYTLNPEVAKQGDMIHKAYHIPDFSM